jgi:tetratricopeptide (TPR) repeat protein
MIFIVDAVVKDPDDTTSRTKPRVAPAEENTQTRLTSAEADEAAGGDTNPAPGDSAKEESEEVSELIQKYEEAIKKDPFNYALWTGLSNLHLNHGDLQDAIFVCKEGIKKHGASPSPSLALSNIYAAAGRFKLALEMQGMRLFNVEESILWLALECKDPFITPDANDPDNRKILLEKFNPCVLALAYV